MNRLQQTVSRQLIIVLGFFTISSGIHAQKQSKTFKESFNVGADAVLDINTSYADIEFETWDKGVVEILTIIELEGATKKEAGDYFENEPIKILGNSKKIAVTSRSHKIGFFGNQDFDFDFDDLHIEIPEVAPFVVEIPEIAPFPEIMEMPVMPLMEGFQFDYGEYKKDGEKYMKKWQKNFEKNFNKKHQKKLEEWAEKMEKRAKEMENRMEEREHKRMKIIEKREALAANREAKRIEQREKIKEAHKVRKAARERARVIVLDRDDRDDAPNVFYFSSDGEHKNFKIKKTIKIKMPKSTRIKMNVRHGEVKLAEDTRNLNATLSHSSLWGTVIDGNETNVLASYSPLIVQKWNNGLLKANYSKSISLAEVLNLRLQATSSDVTIDKLVKNAYIKNDFGPLRIVGIDKDFEEVDISLKNAELEFPLPSSATTIYVKGTSSKLSTPANLKLSQTKNGNTVIHRGFHLRNDNKRSIMINAQYSDVVVQ
ncbi:hypothetical protein [Maribacter sp. 2304DJ31-5]|uniref:hypothetical protein n=1 Tax=Maribacter sp. 2304DJ31-5 TaxID=3386273 RepID=UPI0039BC80D3